MKVLVPLDQSDLQEIAIPAVRKLLATAPDAELHLLTVLDPRRARGSADREADLVAAMPAGSRGPIVAPAVPRIVESHGEALERVRLETCSRLATIAERELADTTTIVDATWSRKPAERIVEFADEIDADVIVMATRGRSGLGHIMSGSVTESVVRQTSRPVLVVGPAFAV